MTTFLQSFFFGISSVSLSQKTKNEQVNFGIQVCLPVDSWAKRLRFLHSLVYKLILKAGRFGFIFLVSQVGCSVVSQLQQNFFRCCVAQRSESRWTYSFRHNNKAKIFNSNQIFHYTCSNELVHFRVIAPVGNTTPLDEMLQRWWVIGNAVSDLTAPRCEPPTYRSRDKRATVRPTSR